MLGLPLDLWVLIEKGGIPLVTLYLVFSLGRKIDKLIETVKEKA